MFSLGGARTVSPPAWPNIRSLCNRKQSRLNPMWSLTVRSSVSGGSRDSRLFDLRQPMLLCKTVEPGAVSDLRGHTVAVQTHLTSLRVSPAVLKKVFWFYSCRQNRLWKSLHFFICFKMNGIVERLHTTYHPSRLQSRESLSQSSYCVTSRSHLGSSSWVHTPHMLRCFIKSRWYFLIWNGNTTFSVTDMSDVPSRV